MDALHMEQRTLPAVSGNISRLDAMELETLPVVGGNISWFDGHGAGNNTSH